MTNRENQNVPVNQVRPAPQVREHFDQESLLALAMTLKSVGMRQPITVRRVADGYEIILGERRWRAAQLAGMTTVPVVVEDRNLSEAEVLELQLVENCAREDLNPIEKAKALDRLMKTTGWTAAEVARRTGCSAAGVSKLTSLLLLPPDILARVQNREVPYSTAYSISRIADVAEQRRLIDEAVSNGLSRDRVVARIKEQAKTSTRPRARRPAARRERVVISLGGGRSVALAGPGLTLDSCFACFEELMSKYRAIKARCASLADLVKLLEGGGS